MTVTDVPDGRGAMSLTRPEEENSMVTNLQVTIRDSGLELTDFMEFLYCGSMAETSTKEGNICSAKFKNDSMNNGNSGVAIWKIQDKDKSQADTEDKYLAIMVSNTASLFYHNWMAVGIFAKKDVEDPKELYDRMYSGDPESFARAKFAPRQARASTRLQFADGEYVVEGCMTGSAKWTVTVEIGRKGAGN